MTRADLMKLSDEIKRKTGPVPKAYRFTVLLTQEIYLSAREKLLWKYVEFKDYTYGIAQGSIVAIETNVMQLVLDLAEMVDASHSKEEAK